MWIVRDTKKNNQSILGGKSTEHLGLAELRNDPIKSRLELAHDLFRLITMFWTFETGLRLVWMFDLICNPKAGQWVRLLPFSYKLSNGALGVSYSREQLLSADLCKIKRIGMV